MKFEKGFDPGQHNSYTEVNMGEHSQYLPNVTELTIINGESSCRKGRTEPQIERTVERETDVTRIRPVIMQYVSRLQPDVRPEWKQGYMTLWEGILDLDAVAAKVYHHGKQPQTDFNKYLVCNIIHYLNRKGIFRDNFRDAEITRALEGDESHSIRTHAVNKDPDEAICHRIDKYMENIKLES